MSFSFERRFEIEWGHCDPAGIVFHPRYFEWFDGDAAYTLAAATGMNKHAMQAAYGLAGIPVVEVGARFHAPCRYNDVVRIVTVATAGGRTSFRLQHSLYRGDVLAAEGWSKRVWAGVHPDDPARMRGIPLPPELSALFGPAE